MTDGCGHYVIYADVGLQKKHIFNLIIWEHHKRYSVFWRQIWALYVGCDRSIRPSACSLSHSPLGITALASSMLEATRAGLLVARATDLISGKRKLCKVHYSFLVFLASDLDQFCTTAGTIVTVTLLLNWKTVTSSDCLSIKGFSVTEFHDWDPNTSLYSDFHPNWCHGISYIQYNPDTTCPSIPRPKDVLTNKMYYSLT